MTAVECVCPGCELQRVAGDLAKYVAKLPHEDHAELVILRFFAPAVYLHGARRAPFMVELRAGGDRRRPFVRALLGDVSSWLDIGASAHFRVSWPQVLVDLALQPRLTPFVLERNDLTQRDLERAIGARPRWDAGWVRA